jgi:phage tail-like protein
MFNGKELEALYKKSLSDPNFRTTVTITLQDRLGKNTNRTWKLAEAWVSSWEGTDLDASSEDTAIEKITIEFEYFL